MQKILFSSLLLTVIVSQCESTPIFDHIKEGFDKAHNAFHQFTCKIKDHRGCKPETTTESISETIEPVDMIDIRLGNNNQEINLIPEATNGDNINSGEGKRVINVNTCVKGYRRDRTGVCRQIL